jgi:hypothetical protein
MVEANKSQISEAKLRDTLELLKSARNNINDAIAEIIDAIVGKEMETHAKYATKLIEAAITILNEALRSLKGG